MSSLSWKSADLSDSGIVIKGTAGQLNGYSFSNMADVPQFVKLYNKATAPNQNDTPVLTIMIPPGWTIDRDISAGVGFAAGISIRGSGGSADNDNSGPSSETIIANVMYT